MKAKKHYGQNFLKSEAVIEKIIAANNLNTTVIEIGPGLGALTKHLVKSQKLIAFEIDTTLKPQLDQIIEDYPNSEVIYEDFLTIDLESFFKQRKIKECIVIANIPYYITGPILNRIAQSSQIQMATLMVQKEVGDRLLATKGKTYGALSVLMSYRFIIERVTHVKNTAFYPIPKVDSVVLKLTKTNVHLERINNEEKFIKFVKAAFQQKRKTMVNNLATTYNITKQQTLDNLLQIDPSINPLIRAENVSLETFITYSNGWMYD